MAPQTPEPPAPYNVPGMVAPPRPMRPEDVLVPKKRHRGVPVVVFLILAFFAALAAVYQYRAAIVQIWPGARVAYETAGIAVDGQPTLEFRNVGFRWVDPKRTKLEVWGEVVNVGGQAQSIPPIRFSMRGEPDLAEGAPETSARDGAEESRVELYSRIIPSQQRRLAPGASNTFSFSIDNPPPGAIDITVDFVREARR